METLNALFMGFLDEGIPLLLLLALGLTLYRGFKKNHTLLAEREDLLRRYFVFRLNRQIHLKTFETDPKAYQGLLRSISTSWKIFKQRYDHYFVSLSRNTSRTKLTLLLITLGLVLNSFRMVARDYYFIHSRMNLLLAVVGELPNYILVLLAFLLMRAQTCRILLSRGKIAEMDRETLFIPNSLSEEEFKGILDEFEPMEEKRAEDGKEDQD
jgi:hypothetical protein